MGVFLVIKSETNRSMQVGNLCTDEESLKIFKERGNIMSKELCAAVLSNAIKIGNKKFANVPLNILSIDTDYQRTTGSKLKKLTEEWDEEQCDPLLVSYRDDKFFILDGQHRWIAAKANHVECLPCKIYTGLSKIDEARLFAKQDLCVTKLTPYDTYKANLVIGDIVDTAIRTVCHKHNIMVSKNRRAQPGHLNAIVTTREIFMSCGSEGLDWVFSTIHEAGWHQCKKAYGKTILTALKFTYENYKSKLSQIEPLIVDVLQNENPNSIIVKARHKFSHCTDKEAVYRLITNGVSERCEKRLKKALEDGDHDGWVDAYQTLFN